MVSGRPTPDEEAKTRRRLEALTAELAGIKQSIDSTAAEIIQFRLYHLELHHRATQLAADMQWLKNQRK